MEPPWFVTNVYTICHYLVCLCNLPTPLLRLMLFFDAIRNPMEQMAHTLRFYLVCKFHHSAISNRQQKRQSEINLSLSELVCLDTNRKLEL